MSNPPKPVIVDPYRPFPSLKGQRVVFSSSTPFTPSYVQLHTPSTSNSGSQAYTSRVQGRQILLENPAKESKLKKERTARRARQKLDGKRKEAGIISRKEQSALAYDAFMPIHHMWCSYMAELMNLQTKPSETGNPGPSRISHRMPNAATMHAKLVKADFHGCIIKVQQSRNPSLVGCCGIIIHETENTFKIVTEKNSLKVIPKENSIFTFSIPLYGPIPHPHPTPHASPLTNEACIQFELYGNQFRFRSADRATRKFKPKETIEL
ncbi:hypothetical protein BS47DRAFT_1347078 [Hydnum rufescens UP504]|uniref:Uncharacterized protein n=1 Tax=Hydnum rufescens UP504 TaxID=1448309 RepID=A0A9P6ASQ7_9AGAM|nr:hypothetical protein BS47DRAFT_1347078 [Hydnum rufescens UP504]